jgi:hypothetical protein
LSLILSGSDGLSDIDGTAATPAIRGTDTNTGIFFPAADTIAFSEGGAEAMRIDSDGDVGIGTTSPATKLHVTQTNDALPALQLQHGDGDFILMEESGGTDLFKFTRVTGTNDLQINNITANNLRFATDNTERMRITSSGNLLVGTTTNIVNADFRLQVSNSVVAAVFRNNPSSATTETVLVQNQQTSGDNKFIIFATDTAGTQRGNIDYNRGAGQVRYNTTSDATLKNLIGDSDKQKSVEILNSTKIREYTWKEDAEQKPQIGVIAQELYETYKGAVVEGGKDANGDYKPWGVDKTAFTFHLIAGWQEHQKLIQELKATVDAQAARIAALEAAV